VDLWGLEREPEALAVPGNGRSFSIPQQYNREIVESLDEIVRQQREILQSQERINDLRIERVREVGQMMQDVGWGVLGTIAGGGAQTASETLYNLQTSGSRIRDINRQIGRERGEVALARSRVQAERDTIRMRKEQLSVIARE